MTDYKRKYEEALERAKQFSEKPYLEDSAGIVEYIFPELKESEDERIRKELIEQVVYIVPNDDETDNEGNVLPIYQQRIDKYIAWLEKQGEKGINGNEREIPNSEQKPADKVEPKFHEGDWLIYENGSIYYVNKVYEHTYELVIDNGDKPRISHELIDKKARLWTIQDTKAGDVLVCRGDIKNSNGIKYERICLFNNLDNAFFTLTKLSNLVEEYDIDVNIDYPDNTVPATKEQKEILFMVMADDGYTFDFEKKELKKIEPKPSWSEKDMAIIDDAIFFIQEFQKSDRCKNESDMQNSVTCERFLIFIKDKVAPQSKQEWSEEDENKLKIAIENCYECGNNYVAEWLKSLRPQSHWKPSEHELEVLKLAAEKDGTCLMGLYEQLKKLKG